VKKSPKKSRKAKRKERLLLWFLSSIAALALLAFVIFYLATGDKGIKEEIIVTVNGQDITSKSLDGWYKLSILPQYRGIVSKDEFLQDSLVPQAILVQEAQKENIEVPEDELDSKIGQFFISGGLSADDMEKALEEDNLEMDFFRESVRQRLLIEKLLDKNLLSEISVEDSEVDRLYSGAESGESEEQAKEAIRQELLKEKKDKALLTYFKTLIGSSEIVYADEKSTFTDMEGEVCSADGRAIARLFITSSCSECKKASDSFKKASEGTENITSYTWELDTGDNLMTESKEAGIPKAEFEILKKFNPENTVPTYVLGCRHVRVGNAFEDPYLEEQELRKALAKIS